MRALLQRAKQRNAEWRRRVIRGDDRRIGSALVREAKERLMRKIQLHACAQHFRCQPVQKRSAVAVHGSSEFVVHAYASATASMQRNDGVVL